MGQILPGARPPLASVAGSNCPRRVRLAQLFPDIV